jgi:hypothetical protein
LPVVFAVVILEAAVPLEPAIVIVKPEAMTFDIVSLKGVVGRRTEGSIAEMFLLNSNIVPVCGRGLKLRSESREDPDYGLAGVHDDSNSNDFEDFRFVSNVGARLVCVAREKERRQRLLISR